MNKTKIFYIDNLGHKSTYGRFTTKSAARKELRKITSKPKKNKYGVRMTSYRETGVWGVVGINNPRIEKIKEKYIKLKKFNGY